MSFKHILFDFDGTLFDSSAGVFKSFDHVVSHYGLDIDKSIYSRMIGPPLKESFVSCFHLPESEVPAAINVYREYYEEAGMYECTVYPGIEELLTKLRQLGFKTYVATSKPELYARQIIERKNMSRYFDFIGGSDLEEKYRVNKIDVISYVLETQKLSGKKDEVLMIGDRFYDVQGAHEAGIKCMGILWGFGTREEFKECGADYIEESTASVEEFFKKNLGDE
ncbi:MAG: HAD hydrolase-like protein [Treponema sp.]|nr:HAD hydrolase-like protein [Treponema sp.]